MQFTIEQILGIDNVTTAKKAPQVSFGQDSATLTGDMKTCSDYKLQPDGSAPVRNGMIKRYSGSSCGSWWASADEQTGLFVEGTTLKALTSSFSGTSLKTGLEANKQEDMRYIEHNGLVFMGNNHQMLKYDGSACTQWGTDEPWNVPVVSTMAGGQCDSGRYYVGFTYVQSNGNESGMSPLTYIDITTGQGIAISGLLNSSDTQISGKRVYITTANGKHNEAMFLCGEVGSTITAYNWTGKDSSLSVENTTWDYRRPQSSNILLSYYARVYIAVGRYLFGSEDGLPESFRLVNNVPFHDDITHLTGDTSGIYVHTFTRTYYIQGRDITDFVVYDPIDIGAIKQMAHRTGANPIWMSPKGWATASGGQIAYIDEKFRIDLVDTAKGFIGFNPIDKELLAVVKQ
jgi:hypothetical protein